MGRTLGLHLDRRPSFGWLFGLVRADVVICRTIDVHIVQDEGLVV